MSLQSFGFFGFLLVVAAVYLHLPQRWQSAFLLAASWYFYAKAMPAMLPVTIAIAACTYACGRAMHDRAGRCPQNGVPTHWRCRAAGDPGVL